MIKDAPSYAPLCATDRTHSMVFCENCGPEEVWCQVCHNRICGQCYENLGLGIWMNKFFDTFIYENCDRTDPRGLGKSGDRFCKLEAAPYMLCDQCKIAAPNLDRV